ncbi:unnamed protein product [Ceutorhynchus assimilis]|uniref:Suppressor of cytokine signaling 5 n=1 Tax=Ceutorhynchus assimilis TaxID=467358 RepID=A0A9N9MFM4_9CUCU|nr:unnamed protein product [Ceutorhynchus assimilis]
MDSGQQEKCSCTTESDSSNSESPQTEKRSKMCLFNLRKARSLHFNSKRNKKPQNPVKKSPKWSLNFNSRKETKLEKPACCKCACARSLEEPTAGPSIAVSEEPQEQELVPEQRPFEIPQVHIEQAEGVRGIYGMAMGGSANAAPSSFVVSAPFLDSPWMRMIHEDCDEAARIARAREIEQGVEPPANFRSVKRLQVLCSDSESENGQSQAPPRRLQLVCPPDLNVESLRSLFQNHVQLRSCPLDSITGCHTQVDFIHCLVPDLLSITNCSFYWGKMDRYEAERLLEGKPEGTFLLRDSAQEEFLFSVSFRKYGRSLHARIEQWNHRFSFDSHDPGVFTSDTVCGLIEHYKDPSSCMFFEPMLTWPLHRNFTFSLQHLARAVIVNKLTYDNINHLQLPKTLKSYLKEYHYRQKVRVERFDDDVQWLELRNMPP